MKKLNTFLLLLALVGGFAPLASASDRWETLQAINWVENPTNHSRYGSKGELGPYQFRPQTWRVHTNRPFTQAVQREAADEVAVKHYEWIRRGLTKAGIEPSPYNVALVWNCGMTAVKDGRIPSSTYQYADRVNNLVETLKRRAPVATAMARHVPALAAPRTFRPSIEAALDPLIPTVNFVSAPASEERFVVAVAVEETIPVVVTDKVQPRVERPMFVLATVTTPRFALFE